MRDSYRLDFYLHTMTIRAISSYVVRFRLFFFASLHTIQIQLYSMLVVCMIYDCCGRTVHPNSQRKHNEISKNNIYILPAKRLGVYVSAQNTRKVSACLPLVRRCELKQPVAVLGS